MIRPHINISPFGARDLLQLARRPGSPPEIVQPPDDLQHRRQRHAAGVAAEAGVRAHAVVDVSVQRAVGAHGVGVGEEFGFVVGLDLGFLVFGLVACVEEGWIDGWREV